MLKWQQELKPSEILLVIDPSISSCAGFVLRLIALQSRLPVYNCSRLFYCLVLLVGFSRISA